MDIVFTSNKLVYVSRQGAALTALQETDYGDAVLTFYNHFYSYAQKGSPDFFFGSSEKEQADAVAALPMCQWFDTNVQEILNCYAELSGALTVYNMADSAKNKLLSAMILHDGDAPGELEDAEPRSFKTFFAMLDGKIVSAYEVNSLPDFLALDFYYATFGSEQNRIAICPWCHRAFRQSKTDQIYCKKSCQENANTARHRKNPYYKKYRSLLQRYSRLVHSSDPAGMYTAAYERWTKEAARTYKAAAQRWEEHETQMYKNLLNKIFPDKAIPVEEPDLPTDIEFAAALKKRWEEILNSERAADAE